MEKGVDPAQKQSSSREETATTEEAPEANEQQISKDGEPGAAREQQSSSEHLQQQNDNSREEDEASATDDQRQETEAEARATDTHGQQQSSRDEEQRSSEAASSTSAATIEAEHVLDSSTKKSVRFAGGPSVNRSDPQPSDLPEAEPSTSSATGTATPGSSLKSSKKARFADHTEQADGVTANTASVQTRTPSSSSQSRWSSDSSTLNVSDECPRQTAQAAPNGLIELESLSVSPSLPSSAFALHSSSTSLEHDHSCQGSRSSRWNFNPVNFSRLNLFVFYILNITNTNPRVDFYIDHIELSLVYDGTNLGYDRVENMDLPRSSTRSPVLLVFVLGLPVSLRLGYTLLPQLRAKDFTLVAEFSAKLKMFILPGLKSIAFRTRYRCELHSAFHSLRQKCVYLNGDKGVPSHKHLRFWRTPEWPYDLNSKPSNFIELFLPLLGFRQSLCSWLELPGILLSSCIFFPASSSVPELQADLVCTALERTGVPMPPEYMDPAYNMTMTTQG